MVLSLEEVDLVALVESSIAEVVMAEPSAQIELRTSARRDVVRADAIRLQQVVRNLLTNAVRYGQGQPVGVEIGSRGDRVRIAVHDRGPGIAPGDVERIFDPYVRLGSTAGRTGLGLGLAIVRSIVEAHGGTVFVESTTGEGSTFIVEIPRQ